jgi:pimeloyl-ACP methyl ester carboxylesterase
MTLAQLQVALRNEGIGEIDLATVVRSATVADIAATATRQADIGANDLIVPLRTTGDAAPLFLIHGWHGQAFVTKSFLQSVPERHPVYSIRARGFDGRQKPLRSVKAMADEYLAAVAAVGHPEPAILGGICAGGGIALEMAVRAKAAGGPLHRVILFDPPLPASKRNQLVRFRDLFTFYLALTPIRVGRVKTATDRMVRKLDRRTQRIGMDALDPGNLSNDVAIKVAVSVGIAVRRHHPSPYDGPVHMIASASTVRAERYYRKLLGSGFERIVVGDAHSDVLRPDNLAFPDAMKRVMSAIEAEGG